MSNQAAGCAWQNVGIPEADLSGQGTDSRAQHLAEALLHATLHGCQPNLHVYPNLRTCSCSGNACQGSILCQQELSCSAVLHSKEMQSGSSLYDEHATWTRLIRQQLPGSPAMA